jgi:hypothetical protein
VISFNVARDKKIADAIEAAQRQIAAYDARIEHARGDRSRREELRKRRERLVKHVEKLKNKA